jgi:hypothetical protein
MIPLAVPVGSRLGLFILHAFANILKFQASEGRLLVILNLRSTWALSLIPCTPKRLKTAGQANQTQQRPSQTKPIAPLIS